MLGFNRRLGRPWISRDHSQRIRKSSKNTSIATIICAANIISSLKTHGIQTRRDLQWGWEVVGLSYAVLVERIQGLCRMESAPSAKRYPASDTVVLRPDSPILDSASCASCVSCTHAPHLVASGASGNPCLHWVPSGHMQLSNPASHAS